MAYVDDAGLARVFVSASLVSRLALLFSGTVDVLRLPLFFFGTSTAAATAVDMVGLELSTLRVGLSFVFSSSVLSFDLATPRRVLRGDAISSSGSSSFFFTRTANNLATTGLEFVGVPPLPRVVLRLLSFLVPRIRFLRFLLFLLLLFLTRSTYTTLPRTTIRTVVGIFPFPTSVVLRRLTPHRGSRSRNSSLRRLRLVVVRFVGRGTM